MNNFLKKSFNLMELSIYMMAVSMLASIVMGASTLMENAKIQKTIEEIYYYENAIVLMNLNSIVMKKIIQML